MQLYQIFYRITLDIDQYIRVIERETGQYFIFSAADLNVKFGGIAEKDWRRIMSMYVVNIEYNGVDMILLIDG